MLSRFVYQIAIRSNMEVFIKNANLLGSLLNSLFQTITVKKNIKEMNEAD